MFGKNYDKEIKTLNSDLPDYYKNTTCGEWISEPNVYSCTKVLDNLTCDSWIENQYRVCDGN